MKNIIKQFLASLTVFFMFSTMSFAQMRSFELENEDGVTIHYKTFYDNDGWTAEVVNGDYSGDIKIPEKVVFDGQEMPVARIAPRAFSGCKDLLSVKIPANVTEIEFNTFEGCASLRTVSIPNTVTRIGSQAFENCSSLQSVELPESLREIGASAFDGCSALKTINMPDSANFVEGYGSGAFKGCSGLTKPIILRNEIFIRMPEKYYGEYSIPEGVSTIYDEAFNGCEDLLAINIPNSVTKIGKSAFLECKKLKNIVIPNSVTEVGDGAFYGCDGITQPIYNKTIFIRIPVNQKGVYQVPSGIKTIASGAFIHHNLNQIILPNSVDTICSNGLFPTISKIGLKYPVYNKKIFARMPDDYKGEYKIPNGIKTITKEAFTIDIFTNYNDLTFVEIPKSVTKIESGAFSGCSNLVKPLLKDSLFLRMPTKFFGEYDIPEGITLIDCYAFSKCSKLTSVIIPQSVTKINERAFEECVDLKEITVKSPNPPSNVYWATFDKVPEDCILKVPAEAINVYKNDKGWKMFKNIVAIDKR